MKKNLILASFAFVFAIGSSFASMFLVAEDVFVKAQFGNEQSQVFCIDTNVQCTNSTDFACTVSVPLSGGGSQIATTGGSRYAYKAGCTQVLGNTAAATLQGAPDDLPTRVITSTQP